MLKNKIEKVEPWEEISREVMFEKFGRGIEKVIFKMQDGVERDYYIKKEGITVAAVAMTEDNRIILVKQFRPGPKKILWELPGGGVEVGQTVEDAGVKELLEETGYEGEVQVTKEIIDDGYSTKIKNYIVVTNCKKVAEQNLEETEFLEVGLFSVDEFKEILRSGQNTDIEIGYLGLDYLGLL